MNKIYNVTFLPKSLKDLNQIEKIEALKILKKIKSLELGLNTDVKKLTNIFPEYRLRVGNYRVIFEIEGFELKIYRIKHRKESYKR